MLVAALGDVLVVFACFRLGQLVNDFGPFGVFVDIFGKQVEIPVRAKKILQRFRKFIRVEPDPLHDLELDLVGINTGWRH